MRTKPCPYCDGRGTVSAERDTLRMTAAEAAAMRAVAIRTPRPPPPEGVEPSVVLPLGDIVPVFEEEELETPPFVHVSQKRHDLKAIAFALLITAVFLGGLAYVLAV